MRGGGNEQGNREDGWQKVEERREIKINGGLQTKRC